MPRIAAYKDKYIENDLYTFIAVQMTVNKIKQRELGEVIGESQQMTSYKLRNHLLTVPNLIAIFERFDVSEEEAGQLMKGKWRKRE